MSKTYIKLFASFAYNDLEGKIKLSPEFYKLDSFDRVYLLNDWLPELNEELEKSYQSLWKDLGIKHEKKSRKTNGHEARS